MSCPTGALFHKGSTVGEMERDRDKLEFIVTAREKKQWIASELATVWLGGCSGCHMSFLDLDEFLIDLAGTVDLVFSPVVDVKEYPENVDVCLIEGAVCNEDNLEILHKIRARTKVLVSFGDCAVTGNVPAMRNQLGARQRGKRPAARLHRKRAEQSRRAQGRRHRAAAADARACRCMRWCRSNYFLPGCPPPADRIKALIGATAGRQRRRNWKAQQLKFG